MARNSHGEAAGSHAEDPNTPWALTPCPGLLFLRGEERVAGPKARPPLTPEAPLFSPGGQVASELAELGGRSG